MILNLIFDFILAGVIIALLILYGLGSIRLFGLRQLPDRVLVAPVIAVAIASIVIGVTVQVGLPIRVIAPYFWGVFVLLAFLGFKDIRSVFSKVMLPQVGVAFVATVAVLHGYMYYGLLDFPGSPALDGWSYVSFGEYLRVYARGTEGGLAPLYQYAAHLSNTRYIASAMLALLILPGVSGLDTQMMVGPFLVIAIYSYASAVGYVAHIVTPRKLGGAQAITVVIATFGGWVPFGLLANNYDNILVLAFAPALFGLASDKGCIGRGRFLVPGLLIAAAVYIYPELAILAILAYFIAGIPSLFDKTMRRNQLFLWLGVSIVALALVSPYMKSLAHFFINQLGLASVRSSPRPGEGIFPDLLLLSYIPGAVWGFRHTSAGILLGMLLGATLAIGCYSAIRAKLFSLLAYLAVLASLCLVMIMVQKYDYGAYKVLLFGWWAIAIMLISGGSYFWQYTQTYNRPTGILMRGTISVIFILSLALWGVQQILLTKSFTNKSIAPYRELDSFIGHSSAKAVSVAVSDVTKNAWLVYQLRDKPAIFTEYHGFMDQPHLKPLMNRSDVPSPGDAEYLIVEESKLTAGEVVWRNELFKVLKNESTRLPVIFSINAPNGEERMDGDVFFWVGHDPAVLAFRVDSRQTIQLDIQIGVGPSVDDPSGTIRLLIEQKNAEALILDPHLIVKQSTRLMLAPGINNVVFRSIYSGVVKANPNGDPRVLLIGIRVTGLKHAS